MRTVVIEPIEPTPDDVRSWDIYWNTRPRHGVRITLGESSAELTRIGVRQLIVDLERESRA